VSFNDRVTYNTFVQFVGKGIFCLSALFLLSLLTRNLGEEGYGAYATILTWVTILKVFSDMGLYMTGVRELSLPGTDQAKVAGNLVSLKFINGLFVTVIAAIVLLLVPYEMPVRAGVFIGLLSVLAYSVLDGFKSVFQARLQMQYAAVGEAAGSLLVLLLSFVVLMAGYGLMAVVSAYVAGSGLNLFLNGIFSRRFVRIRLRFDRPDIWRLIRGAVPLGLSAIMAIIYFRVDLLMLSWMKPMEDVGIYGAAYNIVEMSSVIPVLFLGTVFPLFTRAIETSNGELEGLYGRSFRFITNLAVPMLFGGLVLAEPLMRLITGEEFMITQQFSLPFLGMVNVNPIGITFRILLIAMALMFWGQINGYLMIADRQQQRLLWIYFVLVPANIVLNLLLIPRYSYLGAATATLATEVMAICYTTRFVAKKLGQRPNLRTLAIALICAIPMTFIVWGLKLHVVASVFVGGICYFLMLYLLGVFRSEKAWGFKVG